MKLPTCVIWPLCTGGAKKYPPIAFGLFSRTMGIYDIKFNTLVTDSISRKSGEFHYTTYKIYKITFF